MWCGALRGTVFVVAWALAVRAGAAGPAATDSTWIDHYEAARTAFASEDWAAARHHFARADDLVGGSPNAMYNLAAVEVRLGHPDAALAWLQQFAATGLVRPAARDTLLAPLRGDPRFGRLVAAIDSNATPVSRATLVARLDDPDLLPEDIAFDAASRTFWVSSIHRGKIVAIDAAGRARDVVSAAEHDAWGVFALRFDAPRQQFWGTVSATPSSEAFAAADSGRTAIVCWDARSGRALRRVELFRDGNPHVLGDMTLGPDGSVYASESLGGGVYLLRPGRTALDTLVAAGTLRSPQGSVLTPQGDRLLVADYARGIASIDLRTHAVAWLDKPRSLGASGIDGLYRAGDHLVAIQNGWRIKRLLWLDMDPTWTRITHWSVLERASEGLGEPSHGVVDGDTFYFLGNTGWERVNSRLVSSREAKPPTILRLELETGRPSK